MGQAELFPIFFDYENATQETFLSDEPYEYLWTLRNDKFKQETELTRLAQLGAELGVRNVKTLWSKWLANLRQTTYVGGDIIHFDGAPLALDSGHWHGSKNGIWYDDPQYGKITACSHPIMPVARIRNVDDNTEKLKIVYRRGATEHWKELIVDKDTLASPQKIVSLAAYGISVTSQNAKYLIQYFQDMENKNYDLLDEIPSTTRLGWISDTVFLPYSQDVIFDGQASFRHLFGAVRPEGNHEQWLETVLEFRRMHTVCRIALAASFASVILAKVDALSMFVHLWASESGTGKTVIAMTAASVWGDPEVGEFTGTFNTTETASEWRAAFLNSLPLVMDELQLARDRYGNLRFNVYKISQGSGKDRGTRTGGLERTTSWRLCCITTGETPLTSMADGAGAFARIVDVELDKKVIDLETGQRIVRVIGQNFGTAGPIFIKYLSDMPAEDLVNRYNTLVKQVMSHEHVMDKQGMAAAALLLGDELADEAIFHDEQGRLTLEELLPFLHSSESISIERRAYEYLMDFVAGNMNRFSEKCEYERYGMIEGNRIYIIRSKFNQIMEAEGFNMRSVLSAMAKAGMIETKTEGEKLRYDMRKRLDGQQCRFVSIIAENDPESDETEANDQIPLPFD